MMMHETQNKTGPSLLKRFKISVSGLVTQMSGVQRLLGVFGVLSLLMMINYAEKDSVYYTTSGYTGGAIGWSIISAACIVCIVWLEIQKKNNH